MQYSTEREIKIAARELNSDRELLAMTRQQEAHAHNRIVQVETHANEYVARLSGALRSTEEGQAGSLTQAHQLLEEGYQQQEVQFRDQLQAEWAA